MLRTVPAGGISSRMPPACPVDAYAGRYSQRPPSRSRMPPACPVDAYAGRYSQRPPSRSQCHRLARWIVTLVATANAAPSRSQCHRLARWIVTLVATAKPALALPMPPACPVDRYARRYSGAALAAPNATGLPGGSLRSSLHNGRPNSSFFSISERQRRRRGMAKRKSSMGESGVARNLTIHRASRWDFRGGAEPSRCSEEPNDPPGKPVGFRGRRQAAQVAANLTIHRASRWDFREATPAAQVAANLTIHRASRWRTPTHGASSLTIAGGYFNPEGFGLLADRLERLPC